MYFDEYIYIGTHTHTRTHTHTHTRTHTHTHTHILYSVLSGLGSAGSGQFGSLGVSWNSQVPSTLTQNSTTSKGSKAVSSQQEDDLGR